MKITLHLEGTKKEIANQVADFAENYLLAEKAPAALAPAPAKDKKTATKEAKAATAANAADDDLGFVEEGSEELGLDEEESAKAISKDDVIVAIRDFVKRDRVKNTPKIKTMLEKLGVKTGSVQDIQEKDYQKVMDQLAKTKG